jgi:hypothetical protein
MTQEALLHQNMTDLHTAQLISLKIKNTIND